MKNTYTAPTLVASGDVVEQTRLGISPETEEANPPVTKDQMAGSIGYYL